MSNHIHETAVYKELIKLLKSHGAKFSILGGYPRDLANGVKPKDLDICVYDIGQLGVSRVIADIVSGFDVEDYDSFGTVEDTNYGSEHIEHVTKVFTPQGEIDVIFYTEDFTCVEQVLMNFDYNMNMYSMTMYYPFATAFHGAGEGVFLRNNNSVAGNIVSADRVYRMKKKAKAMGWSFILTAPKDETGGWNVPC